MFTLNFYDCEILPNLPRSGRIINITEESKTLTKKQNPNKQKLKIKVCKEKL